MTKDLFSSHSEIYKTFRPVYPKELYDFIFSIIDRKDTAWDCATGNGQVAQYLSKHFNRVFATDISEKQLSQAFQAPNISYSVAPAEKTDFKESMFDLITVAQALHWIETESFYREVRRTLKPGGVLAVWGYSLLSVDPQIDKMIHDFYTDVVGKYWDEARKHIDEHYANIPFPFSDVKAAEFQLKLDWTLDHLSGYLMSWSATQKYITEEKENPVPELMGLLNKYWQPDETKVCTFPLFLKTGKVSA